MPKITHALSWYTKKGENMGKMGELHPHQTPIFFPPSTMPLCPCHHPLHCSISTTSSLLILSPTTITHVSPPLSHITTTAVAASTFLFSSWYHHQRHPLPSSHRQQQSHHHHLLSPTPPTRLFFLLDLVVDDNHTTNTSITSIYFWFDCNSITPLSFLITFEIWIYLNSRYLFYQFWGFF